jgi:hypothetical protein
MGRLVPPAPQVDGVDPARGGRPVPPVDHRPGLEPGPRSRLPLHHHPAVAGDLEAQERRRAVELDEVDLAADRPARRRRHGAPRLDGVGRQPHRQVEVAARRRAPPGGRSEDHRQPHRGLRRERFAERSQVHRWES